MFGDEILAIENASSSSPFLRLTSIAYGWVLPALCLCGAAMVTLTLRLYHLLISTPSTSILTVPAHRLYLTLLASDFCCLVFIMPFTSYLGWTTVMSYGEKYFLVHIATLAASTFYQTSQHLVIVILAERYLYTFHAAIHVRFSYSKWVKLVPVLIFVWCLLWMIPQSNRYHVLPSAVRVVLSSEDYDSRSYQRYVWLYGALFQLFFNLIALGLVITLVVVWARPCLTWIRRINYLKDVHQRGATLISGYGLVLDAIYIGGLCALLTIFPTVLFMLERWLSVLQQDERMRIAVACHIIFVLQIILRSLALFLLSKSCQVSLRQLVLLEHPPHRHRHDTPTDDEIELALGQRLERGDNDLSFRVTGVEVDSKTLVVPAGKGKHLARMSVGTGMWPSIMEMASEGDWNESVRLTFTRLESGAYPGRSRPLAQAAPAGKEEGVQTDSPPLDVDAENIDVIDEVDRGGAAHTTRIYNISVQHHHQVVGHVQHTPTPAVPIYKIITPRNVGCCPLLSLALRGGRRRTKSYEGHCVDEMDQRYAVATQMPQDLVECWPSLPSDVQRSLARPKDWFIAEKGTMAIEHIERLAIMDGSVATVEGARAGESINEVEGAKPVVSTGRVESIRILEDVRAATSSHTPLHVVTSQSRQVDGLPMNDDLRY